jgi:hypothetical protein
MGVGGRRWGSGDPLGVLTSCCAVAGTPGRGPWGSASGAGSGTGHGQGLLGCSTWKLAGSCGTQAHSTARVRCCGRGAGPREWCFLARFWAPRYSCHRSLATPWEEELCHSEGPDLPASGPASRAGPGCLVYTGLFSWLNPNHNDLFSRLSGSL